MSDYKKTKQKGYAILFTVIIVSAISVITAGLSNAAYKQLILSSLAKDSQTAFFQADTASDCALYADQIEYSKFISEPKVDISIFDDSGTPWNCGGIDLRIVPLNEDTTFLTGYGLYPPEVSETSSEPCFRIDVTKTPNIVDPLITDTTISAKGYNICNKNSIRTVEREIQIDY